MKKTDCPKVVIGVCTYNRCKDLRRLLQSLIKLDYPNFEIIVVDNNSTDQTAQIVSGFEKVKYQNCKSFLNHLLPLSSPTAGERIKQAFAAHTRSVEKGPFRFAVQTYR